MCNKFSAAAIAIKSPLVAVRPLMAAAAALQPGPTHFTPLHAECLKAPPHTHAHAACTHMHHAHSASRRGSASLVPPIPRPCLAAPRSPLLTPHSLALARPPARAQVCILAKTYTAAVPMLQQPLLQASRCPRLPNPWRARATHPSHAPQPPCSVARHAHAICPRGMPTRYAHGGEVTPLQ